MAANTAFADFPRLGALHAGDGFLPRQLTFRGSSPGLFRGIVALAFLASGLIISIPGQRNALDSFVRNWCFLIVFFISGWNGKALVEIGKLKPGEEIVRPGSVIKLDRHWKLKMVINGFGSICTFIVMIVFAVTKFKDGAWIIIFLIPALVTCFFTIHHHYKNLAAKLSLEDFKSTPRITRHRVVLFIAGVHKGSLTALKHSPFSFFRYNRGPCLDRPKGDTEGA